MPHKVRIWRSLVYVQKMSHKVGSWAKKKKIYIYTHTESLQNVAQVKDLNYFVRISPKNALQVVILRFFFTPSKDTERSGGETPQTSFR